MGARTCRMHQGRGCSGLLPSLEGRWCVSRPTQKPSVYYSQLAAMRKNGAKRQDTGYAPLTVVLLRFTHPVQALMRTVRGKLQRYRHLLHVLDINRHEQQWSATQSARPLLVQHVSSFNTRKHSPSVAVTDIPTHGSRSRTQANSVGTVRNQVLHVDTGCHLSATPASNPRGPLPPRQVQTANSDSTDTFARDRLQHAGRRGSPCHPLSG